MSKWNRLPVDVPKEFGPARREAFGEALIDFIVDRTIGGKDKDNKKFVAYTKEYAKFKRQMTGHTGTPDLLFTGDMLGSIEVLRTDPGRVVVGFERGSEENEKADGHISGNVRKDGKARDFLGITDKDFDRVLEDFMVTEGIL